MMKYNISKHVMGGLAAASLMLLTACNNAEYSPLSNQAYIAQTNTNGNSNEKVTIGNTAVTTSVNVRLSDPAMGTSATRLPTRFCRRISTACQVLK